MIDTKELRGIAEALIENQKALIAIPHGLENRAKVRVLLDESLFIRNRLVRKLDENAVIELLDERDRLIELLKFAREVIDIDGMQSALNDTEEVYNLQLAVEACADIKVEQ